MNAAVIDVRVTLPEHWWPIPLTDDRTMRAAVNELVEHEFRGFEGRPLLQSDLRRALISQADAARAAGGRLLALCRQWANGVPVPAALVVIWVDLPSKSHGEGADALLELRDRLHPDPDVPLAAGHALDLASVSPGRVLRNVRIDRATVPTPDLTGAESFVPALVADYWLERPDRSGFVQLAFSSPVVPIRDAWLELWDAIVSAMRWVSAQTE
jgi:hypothetical protein